MKMSTRSTTYGPTNSAATTLRLRGGKLLVAPRGHSRATLRSEPTTRQRRRRRPNKGLWHIYLFISVNLNNPNLIDVVLLSKMLIYRVIKKLHTKLMAMILSNLAVRWLIRIPPLHPCMCSHTTL